MERVKQVIPMDRVFFSDDITKLFPEEKKKKIQDAICYLSRDSENSVLIIVKQLQRSKAGKYSNVYRHKDAVIKKEFPEWRKYWPHLR